MKITNTAHASYKVTDLQKALDFYCGCLGLKQKFYITFREFLAFKEAEIAAGAPLDEGTRKLLEVCRERGDDVWLTYLEVAPHEYIELFPEPACTNRCNFALADGDHIGYLHLALEVDDIHAAYEELKAKGVKIINAPNMGIEATWQFWIEDPDGNSIELMQYTDKSWQLMGR